MKAAFYEYYASLEATHWWFRGRTRILAALLQIHLPATEGLRILDAGTGPGGMHDLLSRFGKVVSMDISQEALRLSREQGLGFLVRADAQRLPFRDASFDLATALDVIEHLDDDAIAVKELARVLRPDGVMIITVPAFPFLWGAHDEVNEHRRRYRRNPLAQLLRRAGLRIEKLSYFNFLLFAPIAAIRLSKRAAGGRSTAHQQPDLRQVPSRLNQCLEEIFALERFLLRRWSLPAGVSLVAIARKV